MIHGRLTWEERERLEQAGSVEASVKDRAITRNSTAEPLPWEEPGGMDETVCLEREADRELRLARGAETHRSADC